MFGSYSYWGLLRICDIFREIPFTALIRSRLWRTCWSLAACPWRGRCCSRPPSARCGWSASPSSLTPSSTSTWRQSSPTSSAAATRSSACCSTGTRCSPNCDLKNCNLRSFSVLSKTFSNPSHLLGGHSLFNINLYLPSIANSEAYLTMAMAGRRPPSSPCNW